VDAQCVEEAFRTTLATFAQLVEKSEPPLPAQEPEPSRPAKRQRTTVKAFESAITADYDAQSAVERELVLRLASLLWRLRHATTMETGLFEIQADRLSEFKQARQASSTSQDIVYALLGQAERVGPGRGIASGNEALPGQPTAGRPVVSPATELARCFFAPR